MSKKISQQSRPKTPSCERSASRVSSACSRKSSVSGKSSKSPDVGLTSPVLGKNFEIPNLYSELQNIELDDTLPYIPVYCHFVVPDIEPVVRPKTPPILLALRAELGEVQSVKANKQKPEQKSRNLHYQNHRRQSNKNH